MYSTISVEYMSNINEKCKFDNILSISYDKTTCCISQRTQVNLLPAENTCGFEWVIAYLHHRNGSNFILF